MFAKVEASQVDGDLSELFGGNSECEMAWPILLQAGVRYETLAGRDVRVVRETKDM